MPESDGGTHETPIRFLLPRCFPSPAGVMRPGCPPPSSWLGTFRTQTTIEPIPPVLRFAPSLLPQVFLITTTPLHLHKRFLMNLILNASEAMKETAAVLTVKTQLGENGQLLISVSDTGVGCPGKEPSRSLMRSLPPSPKAAAWDYLSAARLSSRTEAVCGPRRTTDGVQRSISLCRPQPKPCKCPQLERDSVSLGLPRGDTDRDQGKPTAKKVVALHHARFGKYVGE